MKNVKIFYVGIGGYGVTNLDKVLSGETEGAEIVGVCDVAPEKTFFYNKLVELGVPFYKSMEEFFEGGNTADLTIISTPIPLHAKQSIYAMRHGSNVLVEKPASATVAESLEMKRVSEETGKFVNIGYQSSYMKGNVRFKRDIAAGKFGKPLYAKALVMWPRTETYFSRSAWAGKLCGPDGTPIYDSVANNATAHYLHNIFYALGGADNVSCMPKEIKFELYRGNNIESFDTCALKCKLGDVDMIYLAAHAVRDRVGPVIEFGFENAVAVLNDNEDDSLIVTYKDGTKENYGRVFSVTLDKVQYAIDLIRDPSLPIICSIDATLPHTSVIAAFHRVPEYIKNIPTEVVETSDGVLHYGPWMNRDMQKCYDDMLLPSEEGFYWASAANTETL